MKQGALPIKPRAPSPATVQRRRITKKAHKPAWAISSTETTEIPIFSTVMTLLAVLLTNFHLFYTKRRPRGSPAPELSANKTRKIEEHLTFALAQLLEKQKAEEAAQLARATAKAAAKVKAAADLAKEQKARKKAARATKLERTGRTTSESSATTLLSTSPKAEPSEGSDAPTSDSPLSMLSDAPASPAPTVIAKPPLGLPEPMRLPALATTKTFTSLLLKKLEEIDIESITDPEQKNYYKKHAAQLKKCIEDLASIPTFFREPYLMAFSTELDSLIDESDTTENKLKTIINLYNKLCLKINPRDYHLKLFDMLPFEGAIVSGKTTDRILTKLDAIKNVFKEKGIEIELYHVGTGCLLPELGSDIDIAAYVKTPKDLDETIFQRTVISLSDELFTSLGLRRKLLKTSPPYSHILETDTSISETRIKVDLCFFNTRVEEHMHERGTNLSAVARNAHGRYIATPEIKDYIKEGKVKPVHPVHANPCTEDRLYLLEKVYNKAKTYDLDTTELVTYINTKKPLARPSTVVSAFLRPPAATSPGEKRHCGFALAVKEHLARAAAATSPKEVTPV